MKRYSFAIRQEAQGLRDQGLNYRLISDRVGVSKSVIQIWMNKDSYDKAVKRSKVAYANNPEKHRAYSQKWRRTHPEEVKATSQIWIQNNPEKRRKYSNAWRKKHPDYQAEYRNEHQEEHRRYNRIWYREHPERANKYHRMHPESHRASEAKRRAQKHNAVIKDTSMIKAIYYIAQNKAKICCYLCGKLIPKGYRHVDHVIPLSKGGEHKPSNLAVACDTCNTRKGAKMLEETGLLL